MRASLGFFLVLIGVVFVQSTPVVRRTTGPLSEIAGLNAEFDEFLAMMAEILLPDEYQAFEQELYQLIMDCVSGGEVDSAALEVEFLALMQKYLGTYVEDRSGLHHGQLVQNLIKAVMANVHKSVGKRQALPTASLDDVLTAMPELAALINPIYEALAPLAMVLSPAQLQSLKDQALQLILNFTAGNIDLDQFREQLQVLVRQYVDSNGRTDVDIDNLIDQILGTDTADLPNIIVNIFGKGTLD